MRNDGAWFRWPDRAGWHAFFAYGLWLTLLWVVVYGGASYLTSLHSFRLRLSTEAELAIPFVPAAAAIYLSLFPMLWLAPFVLSTKKKLFAFAKSLVWLFLLSGIGFLFLPADELPENQLGSRFADNLFRLADAINLSFNYFPSLHVGMAVVCARTYARGAPQEFAATVWSWALAIAGSTLLIHQHYLIDVLGGGMLGFLLAGPLEPYPEHQVRGEITHADATASVRDEIPRQPPTR